MFKTHLERTSHRQWDKIVHQPPEHVKLTDVIENLGPEDLIQEEVWRVELIARSDHVHKGSGRVVQSNLVQLAQEEMWRVELIVQSDQVHKGLG